jgi:hypothetical protein
MLLESNPHDDCLRHELMAVGQEVVVQYQVTSTSRTGEQPLI